MSLILHLQNATGLRARGGQQVKITFRGVTQFSQIAKCHKREAIWDEVIQWPVGTMLHPHEVIDIVLLSHGKLRSNVIQGTLKVLPQDLAEFGEVMLKEPILDEAKNKPLETILSIYMQYYSPNGKVGLFWMRERFAPEITDEEFFDEDDTWSRRSSISSVGFGRGLRKMRGLRKKLKGKDQEESDYDSDEGVPSRMSSIHEQRPTESSSFVSNKYQVSITILEARQLAGVDISPAVCVSVGDSKKYTSTKMSTNCPFYNELFVFDFDCPQPIFFDNMIKIQAVHSHSLLLSGTVIGQFKLDVGALHSAPDHCYYHKWAVLADPKDINGGVKGYVKVDMSIVSKSDGVKVTQATLDDEDNVNSEANLLLPDGIKPERAMGRFIVKIFKAEGLPIMNSVMLANVRKVFTGTIKDLVDPYVQVIFAGQKGRTKSKKNKYDPFWNEQIEFTELFPPLCRRMRLEVRDRDGIIDEIISTAFIDLSQIANDKRNGFLPTFGPSWLNLYGSQRGYNTLRENTDLNEGLREGCMYRGRVLLAVKAEVADRSHESGSIRVDVAPALPISENAAGRKIDFFLFGCLMEASLIDIKLGDKPICFELSIGNHGNHIDGAGTTLTTMTELFGLEETPEEQAAKAAKIHSMTQPTKPLTDDKHFYYLPIDDVKPCMDVQFSWEDQLRRMYDQNILYRIADKLEVGLSKVNDMIVKERGKPEKKLRKVMDQLSSDCSEVANLTKPSKSYRIGKSNLDKERYKYMIKEMESMAKDARPYRLGNPTITADNFREKLKEAYGMLKKLNYFASEPQGNLPDVFIWMISGDKRVAYYRIPARKLLYSPNEEERGSFCGHLHTFRLTLPGKKGTSKKGWSSKCKLDIYLWLSKDTERKGYLTGLPEGYEATPLMASSIKAGARVQRSIKFKEKHPFELRSHIYLARGLIGSDDSGLSDPFARVVLQDRCKSSQVIYETLNPTWNQTLVFEEVWFFGSPQDVRRNPPMITIEIYDKDTVGKDEFIGRTVANPVIKMTSESYTKPKYPPALEWFRLYRGQVPAGELLAAFELFQLNESGISLGAGLPKLYEEETNRGETIRRDLSLRGIEKVTPIPSYIRPVLCHYRLEVLFWGMRELKRLQLLTVDRPRVDIECAGHIISSTIIENTAKNPNFSNAVKYIDVDLPEEDIYCPPITIRVVDCRNFGRYTLVGTHVVNSLQKFRYIPKLKEVVEVPTFPMLLDGDAMTGEVPNGDVTNKEANDMANIETNSTTSKHSNKSNKSKSGDSKSSKNDALGSGQQTIQTSPPNGQGLNGPVQGQMPNGSVQGQGPNGPVQKQGPNGSVQGNGPQPVKGQQPATKSPQPNGNVTVTKPVGSNPTQHKDSTIINIPNDSGNTKKKEKLNPTAKSTAPSTTNQAADIMVEEPKKDDFDESQLDWWSKYFTSREKLILEQRKKAKKDNKDQNDAEDNGDLDIPVVADAPDAEAEEGSDDKPAVGLNLVADIDSRIATFKIYPYELEKVPDFHGFNEWLHNFDLYRGKNTSDSEDDGRNRLVGSFRGSLALYTLPLPEDIDDVTPFGTNPIYGYFNNLPSSEPLKVLVRVYIVKATDLHFADITGKADPYLVVKLGKQVYNEKENYVSKQLNPVFGKCFEFEALFPQESMLTIQVYDYDFMRFDDLMGETRVDLEMRYFSKHRAICGLSQDYAIQGYNTWRDAIKPSQILHKLCMALKIDLPEYDNDKVHVGGRTFTGKTEIEDDSGHRHKTVEHLALEALKHWDEVPKGCKLVPEHVEARSLYLPDTPGIEQGKLEMWIDMFPLDMPPPAAPVDITPRKPKTYELRVIIWNTYDVILEDSSVLTGEKMSDIYVKGWLNEDDVQSTDVHYRSLTGEGNFNWRFVFRFDYLSSEEKIVIVKKESKYALDETEYKIPPRLNLQVWDNDTFSSDDILGSIIMDLNRFPRGAKDSKHCTLNMLKTDGSVPQVSMFKMKRMKGFWPFARKKDQEELELTGKVEAELILVTEEESEKSPVGLARKEPEPLDKPNRPDSSFIFFMGPLRALKYLICVRLKWLLIKLMIMALISALLGLFFYSMPGYTVKKMFGV
ncbi:otoferlin-like isoform X1 [Ptychodera flava]|uniref:otoferlin-like isoform X1 n=1 Tax=Ptychodera flava TaxID=63121 RepID=UPI003969C126